MGPVYKFAQHKDLARKLIDTGDAVLIEDSRSIVSGDVERMGKVRICSAGC